MKNISHQRSPSLVLPRNFSGHEKLRNPDVAMYSRNALDSETINSPSAPLTALILVKSEGVLSGVLVALELQFSSRSMHAPRGRRWHDFKTFLKRSAIHLSSRSTNSRHQTRTSM